MSDPKRWMLEWDEDKGCSCGQKEHPEGDFVYYSAYAETKAAWRAAASRSISYIGQLGEQSAENARLKADLEKSDGVVFTQAVENERLKAEVELLRKNADISPSQSPHEQSAEIAHLRKEIEELKSQPDPLTVYLYAAELGKDAYKKLKAELAKTKADVERLECAIITGNAITPDAKPE